METALVGLIGVLIGSGITYLTHREGLGVKMIEIAIGLLAEKPDPSTKVLRDWAVDILAHYSRAVPLSAEAKDELRKRALPITLEAVGITTGRPDIGRPWLRGAGATGESAEIFDTPLPMRAKADEGK